MQDVSSAIKKIVGEEKQINIYNTPKRIPLPANIMVFQAFAYLAATRLKDCSNRVLMLLFSKSGYENFVSMDIVTIAEELNYTCLLYTSPSPRDRTRSRMPSSA